MRVALIIAFAVLVVVGASTFWFERRGHTRLAGWVRFTTLFLAFAIAILAASS
jgi:hypothetical protein